MIPDWVPREWLPDDWEDFSERRIAAGMDWREVLRDHPDYWRPFPVIHTSPIWEDEE